MATDKFLIAKTFKDVRKQQFLSHALPNPLIYRGKTTDNTQTEIYIEGKKHGTATGQYDRLYLPESSWVMGYLFGCGYNVTDDVLQSEIHNWFSIQNINATSGYIADMDTVTGGNQEYVAVPGWVGKAAGSSAISITADDTNDAAVVKVTGTTGKTIVWTVFVYPFAYSAETNDWFYGDSAAGNGT